MRTAAVIILSFLLCGVAAAQTPLLLSQTAHPLCFYLVESADHITPLTGASPTVTISKDGASFASPSGSVTEIGSGWYKVAGNATDENTKGDLLLHATAASGDPSDRNYRVVAYDPDNSTSGGLSDLDTNVGSRMATYTQPTGFLAATFPGGTVANTTNITAGTITTATNVTNQVTANVTDINSVSTSSVTTINANLGETQPINFTGTAGSALVKDNAIDWASGAIPTPNVTGVPLIDLKYTLGTVSPAAAGSVSPDWAQVANPTHSTNLSATTINLANTATTVTNQLTAAAIATGILTDTTSSDYATSGSFGYSMHGSLGVFTTAALANAPTGGSAPTTAQIATAVWEDLTAGGDFGTSGSIGLLLVNDVNGTITSRMASYTQPTGFLSATFPSGTIANTTNITAGTITTVSGNVNGHVGSVLAQVNAGITLDGNGYVESDPYAWNGGDIQNLPANFANFAIDGSGHVTVGQNLDKSGYSLSTAPPTAATIATAIFRDTTASDFTLSGSFGYSMDGTPGVFTTAALANGPSGGGGGGGGSGANTVTVNVEDSSSQANLLNAKVRLTSGSNSYILSTNSSGNATPFGLDNGTYSIVVTAQGYAATFDSQNVSSSETINETVTALPLPSPAVNPGTTNAYTYTYDGNGNIKTAVAEWFEPVNLSGPAAESDQNNWIKATSNGSGLLTVALKQSTQYSEFRGTNPPAPNNPGIVSFTTPATSTYQLPYVAGNP